MNARIPKPEAPVRGASPGLLDAILEGFVWIVMRVSGVLTDLYEEIELSRSGGLMCAGTFYPMPERFMGTEHAEAFRRLMRHLWGPPLRLSEIRHIYTGLSGVAISETVWLEVLTWFMDQGLLTEMIDDRGEVRYFSL